MKYVNVKIKGTYDQSKTTTIRVRTGGRFTPMISRCAYQDAIKRMGLTDGDYPRLAEDYPPCILVNNYNGCVHFALI